MNLRNRYQPALAEDGKKTYSDYNLPQTFRSSLAFNEGTSCFRQLLRSSSILYKGSWRQKCYISLGIWLSFVIFTSLLDKKFRKYGITIESSSVTSRLVDRRGFAVVINTYKRPDKLKKAISHYGTKCGKASGVRQIFVVWAEVADPPSAESFFENSQKNIRGYNNNGTEDPPLDLQFLRVKDSLNSRFLPIDNLTGDAVFMVDDDIEVSCSSLNESFKAWGENPDALVGYYPRIHTAKVNKKKKDSIVYHTWVSVFFRQTFSMILTKACFMHKKYLALYSNSNVHPTAITEYVDDKFNCEDIAMALLVSNATKNSNSIGHVYTEGSAQDLGLFGGISTGSDHFTSRTDCLTDLISIYKDHGWGMPLYDLSLQDVSWLNHFPGYWWQTGPSGIFEWFPSADIFQ